MITTGALKLYNIDGRAESVIQSTDNEKTILDIRGLSAGVYVIEYQTNSQKQLSRLIVLQ
jgi:hypothetical protein